ncbi:Hypp6622 [Branchiostoma lanceolatum]|uniref:Hypp6622 protein n=1 Tax=Branchiostoma lanceolatum TaxID=7740 RepID=A0A8J9YVA7_BRALA|nr:Hypp6622 [Branchiostoma lanceolatum]
MDIQLTNILKKKNEELISDMEKTYFVKRTNSCPDGPYTILAVHIPGLAPELFDSRKLQDYTYEVIGGNHTRLALQTLHSEDPDENIFKTTMARVYCDLPDSLARKVGIDHNKIQFALPPSAADRLFSFRAAAYAETGYTDEADLTTVEPLLMKDKESRWMDGLYVKGPSRGSDRPPAYGRSDPRSGWYLG